MSNSVDPDETAHYEPSHLDLLCLPKTFIIAYVSERVNNYAHSLRMNLIFHGNSSVINTFSDLPAKQP